jgi:hypothetical protein
LPFTCPTCQAPGTLDILAAIELPPDSRSDEIALQVVRCELCGMRGLAVYEESRRGRLDTESIDHMGYYAPASAVEAVLQAIGSCPDPKNGRCSCAAHTQLGSLDHSGQWDGIGRFGRLAAFRMDLSG